MRYGGGKEMRRYYSTTEVAEKTGLDPSQLARLEKLLPKTRPLRGKTGRKLYRQKELNLLLRAADLLAQGVVEEALIESIDAPFSLAELLSPIREALASALRVARGEKG